MIIDGECDRGFGEMFIESFPIPMLQLQQKI